MNKTTANVFHFHDFYYLEALETDLSSQAMAKPELQFRHSFEKLQNDVSEYRQMFNQLFAENIMNYLWAACLGEARHASNMCKDGGIIMSELDNLNRSTVYGKSHNYPINRENLDILIAIYTQEWRSGFGGKAWLDIVEAMEMYFDGTLDAASFIDHTADLEHNGGSAFNKYAREYTGFDTSNSGYIQGFLNYKFAYDILRDQKCTWRKIPVSTKVKRLIERHNNIIEGKIVTEWVCVTDDLFNIQPSWIVYGTSEIETESLETEHYNECEYNDHSTTDETRYVKAVSQTVCSDCLHDHFTKCGCGHYEHDGSVSRLDGDTICEKCMQKTDFVTCKDCGENITEWTEFNCNYYCEDCKDSNLGYCETHEKYYESGQDCEDCENENEEHETEEITDAWGKVLIICKTCDETLEPLSEVSKRFFLAEHPSHKPLPHPTNTNSLQLSLGFEG